VSGAVRSVRAIADVRTPLVLIAIAAAWLVAVISQSTGEAALLHHHALIEGGPPLWIAVLLFLLSWQVMIAAMMLPASLPTIRVVESSIGRGASFLLAFAAVWSVFGLFAFAGDFVLHHVVDATPWLAARPWLIEGGVLGMAGAYQLSPLKRRYLAACRHPTALVATPGPQGRGALDLGIAHGVDCLGSSWALMLLMFAEGFANLWWMVALTVVMLYETTRRHGHVAASVVGLILLGLSAATLVIGAAAA
jgi:predicted metal-binding membrane protein